MTEKIDRNVGEVNVFIVSDATVADTCEGYDDLQERAHVAGYLFAERDVRLKMCQILQDGVDMAAEGRGSEEVFRMYKDRLYELLHWEEFDWHGFQQVAQACDRHRFQG